MISVRDVMKDIIIFLKKVVANVVIYLEKDVALALYHHMILSLIVQNV
jgi:hypothetical protein